MKLQNPAKAKPVTQSHVINPGKFAIWNKDTWKRNVGNIEGKQVLKRTSPVLNTIGSGGNIAGI